MCEYKNCEFKVLSNRYEKNDILTKENRCIFHLSEQNKKQFSLKDREEFKEAINKYIEYKKLRDYEIKFENVVFLNFNWSELLSDVKENKIIFKECVFLENTRFDNIQCKSLEFYDCRFLDGGGIKNREEKDNLNIEKLVLNLYELQGDFVIDIGKYANNNGDIELKTGTIKKIEFSNHQVGEGRVFFVGLNEKLEKGDFRNRILDKVVFENCNLKNCYFLNSKVDKTEFRNVEFPFVEDIILLVVREKQKINLWTSLLIGIVIIVVSIMFIEDISIIFVLFLLIGVVFLSPGYIFLLSCLKKIIDYKSGDENYTFLNAKIGTCDEQRIIKSISQKDNLQLRENIRSLKDLYEQLAINFSKTDKQLSGEFIYGSKFYKSISFFGIADIFEFSINKLHYLVNGYGQRWFRAFWWFISILVIFSWIFTNMIIPNKDYISTSNTPSFLLQVDDKNSPAINIKKSDFKVLMWEKKDKFDKKVFYGYDGRYNFNDYNKTKVLALKEKDFKVGFYKSISNIFYPFSVESKKWFQNVSELAVQWSFIETLLLWLTLIAMFKALWNRIKF